MATARRWRISRWCRRRTAGRNGLEFGAWPTISRISDACLRLPAFAQAHPDHVLNPTVQDTQEQEHAPHAR